MTIPNRMKGAHVAARRNNGACPPDKAMRYSARLAGTGGEPAVYSRPSILCLIAHGALLYAGLVTAVFAIVAIGG
mgnify:CR=1 FL=1